LNEVFKSAEARLDTWSLNELLDEARSTPDPDHLAKAVERAG
jgi:hypothetical protein